MPSVIAWGPGVVRAFEDDHLVDAVSAVDLPDGPDEALDRHARLVRSALGVPTAMVSLVSAGEQRLPGAVGLPARWQASRRTPLSHSFCQYVVATQAPLVVTDAREDEVLRENLAIAELGVVAYAGIPLRDAAGSVVGSLCAIDDHPRQWSAGELEVLTDLAAGASAELQLRQSVVAAQRALDAAGRSREQVQRILEMMPVGYLAVDSTGCIAALNAEAEKMLGAGRKQMVGTLAWRRFPAAVGSDFEAGYRRTVDSGQATTFEAYYPAPLRAWFEVRMIPEGSGVALYFLDVSARRAAQRSIERAGARSALVASVTTALARESEERCVAATVAPLLVPQLGQWCVLALYDHHARGPWPTALGEVASWHAQPDQRELAAAFAHLYASEISQTPVGARALSSGQPVVVNDALSRWEHTLTPPGQARQLLIELDPAAAVVLALPGRGRTMGLLTVLNGHQQGAFATEDLDALSEVAATVGLALDNSDLRAQQRDLAVQLQQSLLTYPPQPDHGQIVVRYTPAAQSAQVGGDWYDAFLTPDGATVLVIGDVIGHDSVAAAEMGQVRGLVRAVAAHTGDGPAKVLSATDGLIQTLQLDTSATAVVARLEQSEHQRQVGTTRLRWSNAGHLPPAVIHPDASVQMLTPTHSDLLLGVFPDAQRAESTVELHRGATVLLYTDGLVERRGQSLEAGLEILRATLADLASEQCTLDELVDGVLARLAPGAGEDDVAVIAVRLHPQDRPRPPEAGPNHIPDNVAPEPT